jgi:hypothetical protein
LSNVERGPARLHLGYKPGLHADHGRPDHLTLFKPTLLLNNSPDHICTFGAAGGLQKEFQLIYFLAPITDRSSYADGAYHGNKFGHWASYNNDSSEGGI